MPRTPGTDFGSYHLIRPLGQGGFAEVWEAESATTGRRVALKILTQLPTTATSNALERFRQEGRLAAGLHHPRCVYVFDAGAVDGVPYISMELMPGGTLADKVKSGALPVAAAVDCVLDMLDGLEAAHAAGIIHRDIKPSNVFLDERGRARIGDFGISKSLENTAALTATGGFLGTPQYASPEQAGGDNVDYRSDLYSAGAVLYELLAGRPPFAGENPAQALARALTQPPEPFPARSAVPPGLQRVVRRLLAKQREKRYTGYQALRHALLPYSSRGQLGAADLARRFGAIVLDMAFQVPINLLLLPSLMLGNPIFGPLQRLVISFLYFTLTERAFGASLGKLILGLRVVTPAGPAPGLGRVAARSAVFVTLNRGPSVLLETLNHFGHLTAMAAAIPAGILTEVIGTALIASTMRRANGYAGVHELASRTRVVVARRGDARATVPEEPPSLSPASASDPVTFGPFRSSGVVWRDGARALAIARDDELDREVWIHGFPDRERVPAVAELQARGEGSLRWLQRGDGGVSGWDAYGAPGGIQLARWVARADRPGWRVLRAVLESLGRELERRAARPAAAPASWSPERVWVAGSGNGVLLDFPVAAPGPGGGADGAGDWRALLQRVAGLGLQGTDPAPLHAQALIARLETREPRFSGPGEFAAALEAVAARPAAFERSRRLASLLMTGIVPALMLSFVLLLPRLLTSFPQWFRDLSTNLPAYMAARHAADTAHADPLVTGRTRESIDLVLAAAVSEARRTPGLGTQALQSIPREARALVDSAVARHPSPAAVDVDSARSWLVAHAPSIGPKPFNYWMLFHVLGIFGIAAVVLAVVLRGPLLLHLFGIAVVREGGTPAGRVRCGVRSLVAWAPLIALPAGLSSAPGVVQGLLVGISGIGAALSVARPSRGPADRIVGTVLVPK